jgi:A/G-specific adenine glycosylase
MRSRESAPTLVREVAVVLRRRDKVLLAQRPASGRWAEMWEFPHTTLAAGETPAQAGARLLAELGLRVEVGAEIITLKHTVTRFRITLMCLEARYHSGRFQSESYARARWLLPEQVAQFPVSSPQRRLVQAVLRG